LCCLYAFRDASKVLIDKRRDHDQPIEKTGSEVDLFKWRGRWPKARWVRKVASPGSNRGGEPSVRPGRNYAGRDGTLPFDEWTGVFRGARMTAALLDRLTHCCTIFKMNGESCRFRDSVKSAKPTKEKKTQEG
jgi:hypothetical protein